MKNSIVNYVLLAVMFLFMGTGNVQASPYSSLDLLNSNITVGNTFSVEVLMNSDNLNQALLAFGFDVNAGTGTDFSYTGYTLGSGFQDNSNGPNNVSATAFPGINAANVLLATLNFKALNAGADTLSVLGIYDGLFSGAFYENSGYDINSSMSIDVHSAAPVPEPATMLLLGSGLFGLAGFRRKIRNSY